MKMSYKVGVVSLGCDKNRVDTENMLAYLQKYNFSFTPSPEEADVIIVNTCAFIEEAKEESLSAIFDMASYKTKGKCKLLAVTGCLTQRYMTELKSELKEADILLGTCNYEVLGQLITEKLEGKSERLCLENDIDKRCFTSERVLTTPYHYAYLRIAEGCDNKCTYCAIPKIRGKYTSRDIESLVAEAQQLVADYGISELIIVAQDITRYGIDIYGRYALTELLDRLSALDVEWIRLLYCYPELLDKDFINYIANNKKICKYIDVPMQHAADSVLKRMGRKVNNSQLQSLVDMIRSSDADIAIRTTFIVGFPNESEEDFQTLCDFIRHNRFEKCGFFAYSREEGTPAYMLDGQISEKVKQQRVDTLYRIQTEIMQQQAQDCVGKNLDVLYEGIDFDRECCVGRTQFNAPEIDANVYFNTDFAPIAGNIYNIKITATDGIDLIGEKYED